MIHVLLFVITLLKTTLLYLVFTLRNYLKFWLKVLSLFRSICFSIQQITKIGSFWQEKFLLNIRFRVFKGLSTLKIFISSISREYQVIWRRYISSMILESFLSYLRRYLEFGHVYTINQASIIKKNKRLKSIKWKFRSDIADNLYLSRTFGCNHLELAVLGMRSFGREDVHEIKIWVA